MRISVIIPAYNDAKDIGKALESLKKQTLSWGEDFEVIVVDGHSNDGTDRIAREMGAKVVYEDIGTRGGACNVGAKQAKAGIIVFTDADAYFPRDWLEKMLRKFEETGADVVGGDDILGDDASEFEKLMFAFDIFRGRPESEKDVVNRLRGVNTAYRKEMFMKVGGFDQELASIEETEMHWRMKKAGAKMVFDPSIFVYHHRRRSLKGLIKQMLRNGIGRMAAIRKRHEMVSAIDILPFAGAFGLAASAAASVMLKTFYPIAAAIGIGAAYFILKPLAISIKARRLKEYPKTALLNFVREISFSIGLFMGLFTKKKPGKKM